MGCLQITEIKRISRLYLGQSLYLCQSRKLHVTHRISILYLFITALLWSTGGLLIKSIEAHPFAIAGGRSIIAGFVLWAFLRKPRFTFSIAQMIGALMYALTVILFVLANKLTGLRMQFCFSIQDRYGLHCSPDSYSKNMYPILIGFPLLSLSWECAYSSLMD